jgi:hypothetical protein
MIETRSNIKRLIINSLKFFGVSVALYGSFILLFSHIHINQTPAVYRVVKGLVWKGGYTLPRFANFNEDYPYDILVFGSSTANRGIHPGIFAKKGLKAYNLGTDDQTPLNTEVLVKHYVQKSKPKLIILDIYDRVFCQSPYESAADFIQNGNSQTAACKMAIQLGDLRTINMLSVRLATQNLSPLTPATDSLINGFRPLKERIKDFSPDNYRYQRDEEQLHAFEKTLHFLKEEGIPVVLTIQPKPLFYLEENRQDFMKDIAPILEKYDAPLVQLSMTDSGLEMGDFADMSHLNKYGAEKYTSALMDKMMNGKLLAESREE